MRILKIVSGSVLATLAAIVILFAVWWTCTVWTVGGDSPAKIAGYARTLLALIVLGSVLLAGALALLNPLVRPVPPPPVPRLPWSHVERILIVSARPDDLRLLQLMDSEREAARVLLDAAHGGTESDAVILAAARPLLRDEAALQFLPQCLAAARALYAAAAEENGDE